MSGSAPTEERWRGIVRQFEIEGSSGLERILLKQELKAFNEAMKNNAIKVTPMKVGAP